jgi:CheY-like chemotaxis protein
MGEVSGNPSAGSAVMPHILSVSYDEALLNSRHLVLESHGYRVTSAWGFQAAVHACQHGSQFDLFILGHSIPNGDKEQLVSVFRAHCSGPVIALHRANESKVKNADYQSDTDPRTLLELVARVLKPRAESSP